jgi:hypothetical protein
MIASIDCILYMLSLDEDMMVLPILLHTQGMRGSTLDFIMLLLSHHTALHSILHNPSTFHFTFLRRQFPKPFYREGGLHRSSQNI